MFRPFDKKLEGIAEVLNIIGGTINPLPNTWIDWLSTEEAAIVELARLVSEEKSLEDYVINTELMGLVDKMAKILNDYQNRLDERE